MLPGLQPTAVLHVMTFGFGIELPFLSATDTIVYSLCIKMTLQCPDMTHLRIRDIKFSLTDNLRGGIYMVTLASKVLRGDLWYNSQLEGPTGHPHMITQGIELINL